MTWFKIMMEGNGPKLEVIRHVPIVWGLFLVKKKGAIAGFFTTRFIEASDADTAIALAEEMIRRELAETATLPLEDGSWNGLVLQVANINTVGSEEVDADARGFSFFAEADE